MINKDILLINRKITCEDLHNHYIKSKQSNDFLFLEMKESSYCNFSSEVMVVDSFDGELICIYINGDNHEKTQCYDCNDLLGCILSAWYRTKG